MAKINGLHHLAISTGNMKGQIEFFTDVLGMELVALYWMHGVEGAWHGFLKLNDGSALAFVFTSEIKDVERVLGVSHSGNPGGPSAPGTMQHVALNVDSQEDLLAMRDRVRSRGIPCMGPVHHGFCSSIYFAGLDNLSIEIATSGGAEHPLDPEIWIDKEVTALAGISEEELARFKNPAPYKDEGGNVAQPAYDPAKPHQIYPTEEMYQDLLTASDDAITKQFSETTPPGLAH